MATIPPIGNLVCVNIPMAVRFAIAQDRYSMLEIEQDTNGQSRSIEMLRDLLSLPNTFAVVFEDERHQRIAGYMIYTVCRKHFRIDEIAVSPYYRMQKVGSALVAHLMHRLLSDRRKCRCMIAEVPEANTTAQMFFRKCCFRHLKTLARGTVDESYLMVYRLQAGTNR